MMRYITGVSFGRCSRLDMRWHKDATSHSNRQVGTVLWTYPHLLWERERRPKRWPKFSLVFEFLLGRVYAIYLRAPDRHFAMIL